MHVPSTTKTLIGGTILESAAPFPFFDPPCADVVVLSKGRLVDVLRAALDEERDSLRGDPGGDDILRLRLSMEFGRRGTGDIEACKVSTDVWSSIPGVPCTLVMDFEVDPGPSCDTPGSPW